MKKGEKPHHLSKEGKAQREKQELEKVPTVNDFEIDPNKTYLFTLLKEQKSTVYIPREAQVWDEETKTQRKIKYSSSETSPYVDEQDENAREATLPISFKNGRLTVNGKDECLIRYLLAYEGNADKKNTLPSSVRILKYKLHDQDKEAKIKFALLQSKRKAETLAETGDETDLRNYMRSRYSVFTEDINELRMQAISFAGQHYEEWLTTFTDPKHKIKADIQKAFSSGFLEDNKGTIKWKLEGGVILVYDKKVGVRADEALAVWALTNSKGTEEFKEILNEKLKK